MRGGSSWLYEVLKSHPDIYVPQMKKEIHFFDRYHFKGLNWYKKFFPSTDISKNYIAIGEVTPDYVSDFNAIKKIKNDLGKETKLILILRNPVDRLYSNYKNAYLNGVIKTKNFEKFIKSNKERINKGKYYSQIRNLYEYFDKEKILILFFEEIVKEPNKELKKVSNFLNVDYSKFKIVNEKVNYSSIPKFHGLFKLGIKINYFFEKKNMNYIAKRIQRLGQIFKKIESNEKFTPLSYSQKKKIYERYYKKEIENLEKLLNIDLSNWKY